MSCTKRVLLAAVAFVLTTTGLATIAPATAQAGTGLFYTVVDADNDPYNGLYLRNWTAMGQVDRVTHRYMLYDTRIELICGMNGEAVGPYTNHRWHKVYVTNNHAAGQTGWVADRYLNTPNKANQPTPNEPECDGNGNPPVVVTPVPNTRGAVYYSPFESGSHEPGDTTINMPKSVWAAGSGCANNVGGTPTFNPHSIRPVTSLAGWSVGRVGPISRVKQVGGSIDYMLLIDPGTLRELNGCDREIGAADALYNWLNGNPNARLVILAGKTTRDIDSKVGNHAHQGIQQVYFPRLRGASISPRVMVCNYDLDHTPMFTKYRNRIDDNPLTSCPDGATKWHP